MIIILYLLFSVLCLVFFISQGVAKTRIQKYA